MDELQIPKRLPEIKMHGRRTQGQTMYMMDKPSLERCRENSTKLEDRR
jgi:hypothetical protein